MGGELPPGDQHPGELTVALDEHIPVAVVGALRSFGIHAITITAAVRRGATDESNLAWARSLGVAFLTHDADFLALAASGAAHAGIIFCHAEKYSIGDLARAVNHLRETARWPASNDVAFI